MGGNTHIEWADHTFNPWIGCTKVSSACDHCYAETLATARLGVAWGPHAERRRTAPSTWRQPLAWNRRAEREGRRYRVFCASLADVFDNQASEDWRVELWRLIRATPHLDWLLLTKRPQNIAKMLPSDLDHGRGNGWQNGPWPNVWLGTTVENQAEAYRRIPHLLAVPAAKRFLSMEPLLGPVDLAEWIECIEHCGNCGGESPRQKDDICPRCGAKNNLISTWGAAEAERYRTGERYDPASEAGRSDIDGTNPTIDWIIAGGESGSKARPSHPDWFRSLRDQCTNAGVPFFFKQWGEFFPEDQPTSAPGEDWSRGVHLPNAGFAFRVGKKRAGALLDGREWREAPA